MKKSLLITFALCCSIATAQAVVEQSMEQSVEIQNSQTAANRQVNHEIISEGIIYVSENAQIKISGTATISGKIVFESEQKKKPDKKSNQNNHHKRIAKKSLETPTRNEEAHKEDPGQKEEIVFADLSGIPGKSDFKSFYDADTILPLVQIRLGINFKPELSHKKAKNLNKIESFLIQDNLKDLSSEKFSIRPPPHYSGKSYI